MLIDLEHTGWGVEGIRPLLAAGAAQDVELLVRVQGSARHLISPSLDLGAGGVMVPMVDDSIEAERVVKAARFAPEGSRGFGLLYPDQLADGVGAAMRTAEDATVVILQIETEAGVEHVEEIAATSGVDVLWVGQFDLSIAPGVPGAFDDARLRRAEDRVLAACAAAGIAAGVLVGSVEVARSMVARGFRMIALGSDIDLYGGARARGWRPSGTERRGLTRGRCKLLRTQRIACHRNTRRPPLREQADGGRHGRGNERQRHARPGADGHRRRGHRVGRAPPTTWRSSVRPMSS